jgi:hypothetical protein
MTPDRTTQGDDGGEIGASRQADRATHEPNPQAVSAVPVGIPDAIVAAMMRCPDYPDFPTAWAIQDSHGTTLDHHPRCSSVPGWDAISGPGFLCDCDAIKTEWARIRDILGLKQAAGGGE